MKLADWMYKHGMTPSRLRRLLGISSRSTIPRYLTGKRRPSKTLLKKIEELTNGEVTEDDFLDPTPAECGEIVEDGDGIPRLIFPWINKDDDLDALGERVRQERPEWERLSPPLQRAVDLLGRRVRVIKGRAFVLDGRPSEAKAVVRAANKILTSRGKPVIRYPGVDPIHE